MRILISDAVLADAEQWPDLESLLDRACRNRCYIDALNPASASANPWLTQASPRRRQEWLNTTSWAAKDSAIYRLRTLIADSIANPEARPLPKINLADVIELVEQPRTLWLENGRNDRRFLLAMMPQEQRTMFLHWEERRVFRFDSRGGLGELRVSLMEIADRGALDARLNRVLFDSDGEVPGQRSRDAEAMIAFCESVSLHYHCLVRRAIENYIPRKALWDWTHLAGPKNRKARSQKVKAFDRMTADQRHHFRMKDGWDAAPTAAAAALFHGISEADRETLRRGIDGDIASVYEAFMDTIYDWASKDGIDPGLQATISDLTEWTRVPYA